MNEEIILLRYKLHKLLETKLLNDKEVVNLSQELDLLIVKYYEEKLFSPSLGGGFKGNNKS